MRLHVFVALVGVWLLAGGCRPQEPSQQPEADLPGNERIAQMVSEAAAVSADVLRGTLEMETVPVWDRMGYQSLTALLFCYAGESPPDEEEFYIKGQRGPGLAKKVAKAILAPTGDGSSYASLIRPEWVTSVTRKEEENRVTGTVSFECRLYRGRANYVAERRDGTWQIVELSMPRSGIVTRRVDAATWRSELPEPPGSGLRGPE